MNLEDILIEHPQMKLVSEQLVNDIALENSC